MFDPEKNSANSAPDALSPTANTSATGAALQAIGRYRWVICGLLLFATTKSYMDRQVLSVLKETLSHDFHWTEIDYSNIVLTFQTFYAVGMVLVGRLVDKLGTRKAFALTMTCWSIASMSNGFGKSYGHFIFAAAALGLGQAGMFPASIKAVAEWFPRKERALATGIFNAGTNIGAILGPLIVPFITKWWGWQWAFIVVGSLGFIWVALWLIFYQKPEEHPRVSPGELAHIKSDPIEGSEKIPWGNLIKYRQTWAFVAGKFLTDPVWWLYLFWAPSFLQRNYGLTLAQVAAPIMVIYIIADVGSVAGGWFSSALISRGATVNRGRKTAMLVCAIAVMPIIFANQMRNMWAAVLLFGLAAAAHQGFSANLYTITSDMFPNRAVGSVTGIGGMVGSIGGMIMARGVGVVLQRTGSYRIPLFMAGFAYLLALLCIQLLAPRLEPAALATVRS
jgi:ACS family hexuronate transporter-like MFS transporter|nr:MFS transporter [Candidatus Acidoferrales bacterium]